MKDVVVKLDEEDMLAIAAISRRRHLSPTKESVPMEAEKIKVRVTETGRPWT